MYLMHLPVLIVLHRGVAHWHASAAAKFGVLCVTAIALLLASYHVFVRRTVIGRVLHGPVGSRHTGRVPNVR